MCPREASMSDALKKGEFIQNARGFYHFYPALLQALSAHDCKQIAARLNVLNAAPSKSVPQKGLDQ